MALGKRVNVDVASDAFIVPRIAEREDGRLRRSRRALVSGSHLRYLVSRSRI